MKRMHNRNAVGNLDRSAQKVKVGAFLTVLAALASPEARCEEQRPVWISSADFALSLNVRDRLMLDPTHDAKYIVRNADGRVFVAEKKGKDDEASQSQAVFPKEFREEKLGVAAWVSCDGKEYLWEIYANGKYIDGGAFSCRRGKRIKK